MWLLVYAAAPVVLLFAEQAAAMLAQITAAVPAVAVADNSSRWGRSLPS
jgi:hypothetical protein